MYNYPKQGFYPAKHCKRDLTLQNRDWYLLLSAASEQFLQLLLLIAAFSGNVFFWWSFLHEPGYPSVLIAADLNDVPAIKCVLITEDLYRSEPLRLKWSPVQLHINHVVLISGMHWTYERSKSLHIITSLHVIFNAKCTFSSMCYCMHEMGVNTVQFHCDG